MKATNLYRFLFATTLCGLLFTACKKSSSSSSNDSSQSDLQTQSDDQSRVSNETDAAFDDVTTVMTGEATITGSSVTPGIRYGVETDGGNQDTVKNSYICNATVTFDTVDNPHTITITYNGKTADSLRSRTGSIVISWKAGTHWTTAGDSVTVQFENLAITRLRDNKAITFNGTHIYTNVSGGSLLGLALGQTTQITHTITSNNMSITFDDGSQRTWSFARQRVFTYNGGLVITESGFHTSGTMTDISEWGTNRFGNSFTAQITTPIVVASSCSWQASAGVYVLTNNAGVLTLTFGLNSAGQATGCPISPSVYYFQLVWAGSGGKTYSITLPY
ncbi:MAG TPA: hypothetical protein VGS79_05980 [Puia sp.]|nr:hypothetical protein [Puia sp.]